MLKLFWLYFFGKKKDFDEKFFKWFWTHYAPWAKYLQWVDPYKWMISDTMQCINPKPGDTILDVGCGCAVMSERIIKKQPNVKSIVGIDVVAGIPGNVLEILDGKFEFKPVDLRCGLPVDDKLLKEKSFDWIVANMVITYFPKETVDCILADAKKLLAVGGKVVFTSPADRVNFLVDYFYSFKSMFSFGPDGMWGLWAAIHILPHVLLLMKLGRLGFCYYLNEKIVEKLGADHGFDVIVNKRTFVGQALLAVFTKK